MPDTWVMVVLVTVVVGVAVIKTVQRRAHFATCVGLAQLLGGKLDRLTYWLSTGLIVKVPFRVNGRPAEFWSCNNRGAITTRFTYTIPQADFPSCVCQTVRSRLGRRMRQDMLGKWRVVSFPESPDFERVFFVQAKDLAAARALLTSRVRAALLDFVTRLGEVLTQPGAEIRADGRRLQMELHHYLAMPARGIFTVHQMFDDVVQAFTQANGAEEQT